MDDKKIYSIMLHINSKNSKYRIMQKTEGMTKNTTYYYLKKMQENGLIYQFAEKNVILTRIGKKYFSCLKAIYGGK